VLELVRGAVHRPWIWGVAAHVVAIVCAALLVAVCAAKSCETNLDGLQVGVFLAAFALVLAGFVALWLAMLAYGIFGLLACIIGTILCCQPCPFATDCGRSGRKLACKALFFCPMAPVAVFLAYSATATVCCVPAVVLVVVHANDCLHDDVITPCLWAAAVTQAIVIAMWCCSIVVTSGHSNVDCAHLCGLCAQLGRRLLFRFSDEALNATYNRETEDGWTDESGDYHGGPSRFFITPQGGVRRPEPDVDLTDLAGRVYGGWTTPLYAPSRPADSAAAPLLHE